jgi:hypothetical protein
MSKHGLWTVIVPDKNIIKKSEDFTPENPGVAKIEDDAFWSQSKFNNISVIQFTDDNVDNDQVEYTDTSPNGSYDESVLGNFRTEFINRFDTQHLIDIQNLWDNDNQTVEDPAATETDGFREETPEEKIARLGPRPTSYTSA